MRSCNCERFVINISASAVFETNFWPLVPSSVCTLRPAQFSSWLSPWRQGGSLEPGRESGTMEKTCMILNMELQLFINHSHVSEMPQIGSEPSCFTIRPNQSCINCMWSATTTITGTGLFPHLRVVMGAREQDRTTLGCCLSPGSICCLQYCNQWKSGDSVGRYEAELTLNQPQETKWV